MEDTIVSFNTASLAYEKGFRNLIGKGYKHPLGHYYNHLGKLDGDATNELTEFLRLKKTGISEDEIYEKNKYKLISAPTQSLLQKWLREIHGIFITIECDSKGHYRYHAYNVDLTNENIPKYDGGIPECPYCFEFGDEQYKYNDYESALEEGLIECLNFIK